MLIVYEKTKETDVIYHQYLTIKTMNWILIK